jgi:hypothetical protein
MNNHIKLKTLKNRLEESDLKYEELSLGNGFSIVVSQRGARIFGPFEDDNSESIMWLNKAFISSSDFKQFLDENDWNIGGDRLWIAPEFPFFNKSRADFYDSYTVQESIDPGNYQMKSDADMLIKLKQDVSIKVFESDLTTKEFSVGIEVMAVKNPLRHLKDYSKYMKNVKYCGYELEVELKDLSPQKRMHLEMWSLSQINPPGTIYMPFNHEFEFVDYYDPIDDEHLKINQDYAELKITGDRRYKVGYQSAVTNGRAAYLGNMSNGKQYLFVKNYFNNPSSEYCSEPYDKPGEKGCSFYVYNDSGDIGGFAEFECSGNTISADSPKYRSIDKVVNWFFVGEEAKLKDIANVLLG